MHEKILRKWFFPRLYEDTQTTSAEERRDEVGSTLIISKKILFAICTAEGPEFISVNENCVSDTLKHKACSQTECCVLVPVWDMR